MWLYSIYVYWWSCYRSASVLLTFSTGIPDIHGIKDYNLQRNRNTYNEKAGKLTSFTPPEGVREKDERPYYPYIMLMADHHTGVILDIHLAGLLGYASEFSEHVLTFLEKIKWVPKEIWVKREESFILLNPITSYLGITLKKVRKLPALDDAQASMAEFLLE